MSRQLPSKEHDDNLDEFLDELDGVDVHDEDLRSWNELDSVEDVVSVPESNKTSSPEVTPAVSRADSPPAPSSHATLALGAMNDLAVQQVAETGLAVPPAAAAPVVISRTAPSKERVETLTSAAAPAAAYVTRPPLGPRGISAVAPRPAGPTAIGSTAVRSTAAAPAASSRAHVAGFRPPTTSASAATALASSAPFGTATRPAVNTVQGKAVSGVIPTKAGGSLSNAAKTGVPATATPAGTPAGIRAATGQAQATTAVPSKADPFAAAAAPAKSASSATSLGAGRAPASTARPIFTRSDTPFPSDMTAGAGESVGEHARTAAVLRATLAGERAACEEGTGSAEGERNRVREGDALKEIQEEEVQTSGGSHGPGGWGGWGTFGSLSAKLTAAAATAVKDVSELTESFQQVLQEIANAPEEEEAGAAGRPATATAADTAMKAPAQQTWQLEEEQQQQGEKKEEDRVSEEELARRQEVLARLEGDDTTIGKGVKVVDQHVDHISAGAGKALSSLWGWGATLAHRVEQVASSAAKELAETVHEASPAWGTAASGLAGAGKPAEGLGAGLSERLGQLGRTAKGLLETGLQGPASRGGKQGKDEVLSFEECFYIYGGQQAFEELEALSNECARLCNRVRGKLSDDDKANLDKVLALLVPLFELGSEHPSDSQYGVPAEPAALARGHAVIADVAASGCARADAMAHAVSQNAEQLLAPPQQQTVREELTDGGEAGQGQMTASACFGPTETSAATAVTQAVAEQSEPSPGAVKALREIQGEGVKRIAEVSSLCIERLQALGRGLQLQFRFGRPADDGITWPAASEAKALLLRGQARRMLGDLEAVTESFSSSLLSAGRALNAHTHHKVFGKMSEGLASGLNAATATGRVQDAFKSLMYMVWLTSVDRDLME